MRTPIPLDWLKIFSFKFFMLYLRQSTFYYNIKMMNLYDKILAEGKVKKLVLIAVCNKLIKQSYAIAKSGLPYDPNYVAK